MNCAITFLMSPNPRLEIPPPKALETSTTPYAAVPRAPMAKTILDRSSGGSPLAADKNTVRLLQILMSRRWLQGRARFAMHCPPKAVDRQEKRFCLSDHIRNLPVLSTIEMSPGCVSCCPSKIARL